MLRESMETRVHELERFMNEGGAMDRGDAEEAFERLAIGLFREQFESNAPFQAYCRSQGKTPRTVRSWKDIPAVPIRAFKTSTLSCCPPEHAEAVFMTSGTTNPEERGRHYHPSLQVYDRSMKRAFQDRVMQGRERIRMGILFPDEAELPNSSLAHYLALAYHEFGAAGSAYLWSGGGIDAAGVKRFAEQAADDRVPVALLGATFSFIHLMDAMDEQGVRCLLPPGSFLLDTGGTKSRSRNVEPDEFYGMLADRFGIPRYRCMNMYGMTELSTQFYDDGNERVPSVKSGPHWIRTRAVDPLTGKDVPPGEPGVLVHCDLANWNSVTTILTEDVGVVVGSGKKGETRFELHGRVQGTAARGCSLAAESFLQSARGGLD